MASRSLGQEVLPWLACMKFTRFRFDLTLFVRHIQIDTILMPSIPDGIRISPV